MTTGLDHAEALRWDPPGPGSWELLADHYPRPITAAMAPFLDVWSRETTAYMKNVGMPLEEARMATVNGLPYLTFIVAGGGKRPPPPWVMKLAMRVVPSLRRAEKRLAEVFEERPWVAGIAQWYDVDRAAAFDRMVAITRLDIEAFDDTELADHVRHCEREVLRSAGEHIALHGHDSVAPGLFAVRAMELGLDLQTPRVCSGAPPQPHEERAPSSKRSAPLWPGAAQHRSRTSLHSDPRLPVPSTYSWNCTAGGSSTGTTSTVSRSARCRRWSSRSPLRPRSSRLTTSDRDWIRPERPFRPAVARSSTSCAVTSTKHGWPTACVTTTAAS